MNYNHEPAKETQKYRKKTSISDKCINYHHLSLSFFLLKQPLIIATFPVNYNHEPAKETQKYRKKTSISDKCINYRCIFSLFLLS